MVVHPGKSPDNHYPADSIPAHFIGDYFSRLHIVTVNAKVQVILS
jgi:hypothetical protein